MREPMETLAIGCARPYPLVMRFLILLPLVSLASCEYAAVESDERQAPATVETAAAPSPQARPVRIGEGGPGFSACQSRATVSLTDPGATETPVRISPFAEADIAVSLPEGATMFVCTRTLDQRWLGVVIPPADAPQADCGVRARVDRPRDYDGPCTAGWIAGTNVRLSGA